jgi:hypothetical protein
MYQTSDRINVKLARYISNNKDNFLVSCQKKIKQGRRENDLVTIMES